MIAMGFKLSREFIAAKGTAVTKRVQAGLGRENYYLGGSRSERKRRNRKNELSRRGQFEFVGHAHQFNDRSGLHLFHDVPAVNFHCGLAGSEFVGNLLVE